MLKKTTTLILDWLVVEKETVDISINHEVVKHKKWCISATVLSLAVGKKSFLKQVKLSKEMK